MFGAEINYEVILEQKIAKINSADLDLIELASVVLEGLDSWSVHLVQDGGNGGCTLQKKNKTTKTK